VRFGWVYITLRGGYVGGFCGGEARDRTRKDKSSCKVGDTVSPQVGDFGSRFCMTGWMVQCRRRTECVFLWRREREISTHDNCSVWL